MDIPFENYSEGLPHATEKSFLLFAKGACAEGRPLRKIQEFIPKQMEEIAEWEQNVRGNSSRPTKSQQMLGRDKSQVYYWSVQLTRASCLCRSVFGADAHQKHVPTSAEVWGTASKFAKLWDATLARNYAHFQTPHSVATQYCALRAPLAITTNMPLRQLLIWAASAAFPA